MSEKTSFKEQKDCMDAHVYVPLLTYDPCTVENGEAVTEFFTMSRWKLLVKKSRDHTQVWNERPCVGRLSILIAAAPTRTTQ